MPYARQGWAGRLVLVGVAGVALLNGGCLAAAAVGAAGGGAAAVYAYQRGRLYRDYTASLTDATAAVRTSLAELQFPPGKEKGDGANYVVETKATDGTTIHVYLDAETSRIPAEGPVTRITVRVGTFGDDNVSARILDQVSMHLVVPPATQSANAAPPVARPQPPRPPETVAPPLAPPATAAK
jgi:hypothetical protein